MRSCWFIIALLIFPTFAFGQKNKEPPRDLIEQRIEIAAERLADGSEVDLTTLFDILINYYQNPLDLNRASREDISEMQLLTEIEIGYLLDHIDRNGKLISIYELQAVEGWDMNLIRLIEPFVKVGGDDYVIPHITFKEVMDNGKHEVWVRYKEDIEQRKGYRCQNHLWGSDYEYHDEGIEHDGCETPEGLDSLKKNSKVYLGSPVKLYTRYRFKYRNNISVGFTAEKDEGEEFFQGTQKQGFDFYSAHIYLKDFGRLKQLAIGDYQAQFGQGLTFWSGFAFSGKSSYSLNIKRSAPGLRPYTSVNENLFLRGAGATVAFGNVEVTTFYSKKKIDGNIVDPADLIDQNINAVSISSFQEDGFHRTTREVEKKDAIPETQYGAHVAFKKKRLNFGFTAARIEFDVDVDRSLRPYNQFEFDTNRYTNIGFDYNFVFRNFNFFGEVARSDNGGVAYLSGLIMALDPKVSLSVLYRHYDRDFQGIRSVAFSEGSNPWNERGLYFGLEIRPSSKVYFNAYFDQFSFDWLRYQTNAPSHGFDAFGQLNYRPNKKMEMYFRIRHRERPRNTEQDVDGIDYVVGVDQTNYRYNVKYKVSRSVSLRNRLELVDYERGESERDRGYIVYQDLIYRPWSSPWELTFRYALFDTDSYDARLYAYENDVPGLWSIPAYYGRGSRGYVIVRYSAGRHVDLWFRYGRWFFTDRNVISSGLQEIARNTRTDIKAVLRFRF